MSEEKSVQRTGQLRRLLRIREVEHVTGLSRSTIYDCVRRGEFPRPVKLTSLGKANGWWADQIEAWQQERAGVAA